MPDVLMGQVQRLAREPEKSCRSGTDDSPFKLKGSYSITFMHQICCESVVPIMQDKHGSICRMHTMNLATNGQIGGFAPIMCPVTC